MKVVLLEAQGILQKKDGKAHETYMERTDVLLGCQQPVMDVGVVHKAPTLLTE